jgi:UDP-N-acetylmuramoyl-L-alanyl-D-glutamate--2,6-diaminopimelate ligase
MDAYIEAKILLLKTPGLQYVVLNLDDYYYGELLAEIPKGIAVIGISKSERKCAVGDTLQAEHIMCLEQGMQFDVVWKNQRLLVSVPIYGEFNIENLLVVLAVLLMHGVPINQAIERLKRIQPIPGRMENFSFGKDSPFVFIDYAHTPDALKNVLLSARAYCKQKLWLVFGCGGDRDQGKRALMGEMADKYAESIIVTDDNPRSEDPKKIVSDILSGCTNNSVEIIHDRELAIRSALQQAGPDDCVVIAGKGHEIYQETSGKRTKFSDRKLLKKMILAHQART